MAYYTHCNSHSAGGRNTADADVIRFLKLFTELPLDEIAELGKLQGADINQAKIVLADEATALLHGKECLKAIHQTIDTMFSGGTSSSSSSSSSTESLPRVFVQKADVSSDGVRLVDLFVELKLASSKKEARRLIQGGGARIGDDQKITNENGSLSMADFGNSNEVTLRAGKKRAGVVEIQN